MNSELQKKSISDLRIMAQAFGVSDIFEKDADQLRQAIEIQQQDYVVETVELPPKPEYDARLMTVAPNSRGDMQEIIDILEPYIKIGLKLSFDHESWFMEYGKRNDSGTIRMPLRDIMHCADRIMS
jgi:hypothetical protein